MKSAAFLGRFQPFHIGHRTIVQEMIENYDKVILVIGSSHLSRTANNPWTVEERENIIRASLPIEWQEKIDIVGLPDTPDDDVWGENLKTLLSPDTILFTGNDWVQGICSRHQIQTHWIGEYPVDISGTRIRAMLASGEDVSEWTVTNVKLPK